VYDSLLSELHEKIRSADLLYHRTVSVVGPPRSGKTRILQALSKAAGVSVLNVSLELGRLLLDLPQKRRVLDAPGLLGHIVESCQTGPAILG
jgi:GTP1/Obg family GTP-binding protein